MPVVIGGHNLPSPVGIGLTDMPNMILPMGESFLAKGKLATIHSDSAPRPQRSCFAHSNICTYLVDTILPTFYLETLVSMMMIVVGFSMEFRA